MTAQKLLLDRVEFVTIKVSAEADDVEFNVDPTFPQLDFDSSKVVFLTRSDLGYPPEEAADPQHFALSYGIRALASEQEEGLKLPYSIELEAVGFFRYVGGDDHVGVDRFRAVRFSGYQILYGAIREMVSNLTARGRHGIWHLPARNFNAIARARAEEDEQERQALLESRAAGQVKKRVRRPKVAAPEKSPSLPKE